MGMSGTYHRVYNDSNWTIIIILIDVFNKILTKRIIVKVFWVIIVINTKQKKELTFNLWWKPFSGFLHVSDMNSEKVSVTEQNV